MIYAIYHAESGNYKIGISRSRHRAKKRRIPEIRKAMYKESGEIPTLKLIQWANWPADAEMCLHRYLWHSWRYGEWFAPSDRITTVLQWMQKSVGYADFMKEFRKVEKSLPAQWHNGIRDEKIRQFRVTVSLRDTKSI